MTCEKQVQIKDKFCLTIDEAAEYFNIGEKKLRKIVADYIDSGFVIQNLSLIHILHSRPTGMTCISKTSLWLTPLPVCLFRSRVF